MAVPATALIRPARSWQQKQPETDGLLKDLGRRTLSGMAMAGNVLDLPGSMVRDVISGENPFDQWASPLSGENRVSGREVLERIGVLGKNRKGFDVGDVVGFAGEVAMDPLSYLGGVGLLKSLGKGGAVLAKASPAVGKLSRVQRMTTKVRDVIPQIAPEALEAAVKGSKYADTASFIARHGNEPAGGLLSLHKGPLGGPVAAIGTGKVAQKIGGALDKLGEAVSYGKIPGTQFSPGRQVARVFSSRAKGLHTPEIAPYGEKLYDEGELIRRGVRAETAKQFTKMANAGELSDAASVLGRLHGEVDLTPYMPFLKPELQKQVKLMTEVLAPFKEQYGKELGRAQFLGTKLDRFGDPAGIDYLHRIFLNKFHTLGKSFGRENYLRGIELGTENLRRMISDPKILEGTPDDAFRYVMSEWAPKFVERTGEEHLFREAVDQIRNVYTPEQRASGGFGSHVLFDQQEGLLGSKLNNAKTEAVIKAVAAFAESRGARDIPGEKMTLWEVFDQAGLNPGVQRAAHDVVPSPPHGTRIEGPVETGMTLRPGEPVPAGYLDAPIETGLATESSGLPVTRDKLQPVRHIGEFEGTLDDIGKAAKARRQPARNGALFRVIDELRKSKNLIGRETPDFLQTIGHMVVPKSLGDDIVRLAKGDDIKQVVGPLMQMFDAATNFFKVSVLNWPSRYSRDFTSSQAMNILTGNYDQGAFNQLHKMISGGVGDFTDIPIIQKMLSDQGLEATAENSTEMMRQLLYTYEKHTAVAGTHGTSEIVGELSGALPSGAKAFAAEFPGRDPLNPLSPSTLNAGASMRTWAGLSPFNVRGVGGKLTSGFKPAAIGERLGRYTDTMGRGTAFITNLKRGVAPEQASRIADALQVNYAPRTFTAAERKYLKRAFPFYSFVSRMLPEVTKQLLNRPGGGIAQSIRAANDLRGESTGPVPEYVGKGLAIPIGETPTGDSRYLTALDLMHEAPLNVLQSKGEVLDIPGTLRNVGAMLNPYLKGPLELGFGKTMFQNRELEDADPTIGRLLTNVGLRDEDASGQANPFLGTTFEHLAANSPASRLLSSLRTATDPRKGFLEKAVNLGTGARISDISPAAQDAVLRDALAELTREEGGKAFESVRFSKSQIADAEKRDPEIAARMRALNAAAAELAARSKARKQQKPKVRAARS